MSRRSFSLEDKLTIISLLESGTKNVDLARRYKTGSSTISTIYKHREILSDETIVQNATIEDDREDAEEKEASTPSETAEVPTIAEARAALGVLQAYCLTNDDLSESEMVALKLLDEAVEKKFVNTLLTNFRQTTITEFVNNDTRTSK